MATYAEVQREMQRRYGAQGLNHHQARRQHMQRPPVRSLTGQYADASSGDDPNVDYYDDYYQMPLSIGNLVGGAVFNGTVAIQSDSQFEWMRTAIGGNLHGLAEPWPSGNQVPLLLQISDGASGRMLFSGNTPAWLIAGTGQLPFINPASRIFQPTGTINVQATNYSTSQYDNIFLVFLGRKLFKGNPSATI